MENTKVNAKSNAPANKTVTKADNQQQAAISETRIPELSSLEPSNSVKVQTGRQGLPPFAESRKTGNIPDHIQTKMERSFGQSFSDVEVVKNSDKAKNLDAIAFTQGSTIHVAPGYDPFSSFGQELLGHELAHVMQQNQGRVSPTHFESGMGINDAGDLEAEADKYGRMGAAGQLIHTENSFKNGHVSIQKISAVAQMWRPRPGQSRVESTVPDLDGAWRAVASAIGQVAGGFSGGVMSELRAVLIGSISEQLAGGLGMITFNNVKTYNGVNLTWRGDIQFKIDGEREISGGGVGATVLGAGGSTTTGNSITDTQTGGTTGSGTISSSPGSTGGTGGSLSVGVSSSSTNAAGSTSGHVANASSSSTVSQVMKRYTASMACFVNMSAETSFGDSGWDYVNPFAWVSGSATGIVGSMGDLSGSASSNCGTLTYYEGGGIANP